MKTIAEIDSLEMKWVQSGLLQRRYTLLAEEDIVATLNWVGGKLPHAVGQAATGMWIFRSSRVIYPRVSIKSAMDDTVEANFEASLKGQGSLLLTNGLKFYWENSNFWANKWEFTNAEGERLVQFKPEQGLFKIGAQVILQQDAFICLKELPLLVITGWYLLTSMSQEDSDLSGLAKAIRFK